MEHSEQKAVEVCSQPVDIHLYKYPNNKFHLLKEQQEFRMKTFLSLCGTGEGFYTFTEMVLATFINSSLGATCGVWVLRRIWKEPQKEINMQDGGS